MVNAMLKKAATVISVLIAGQGCMPDAELSGMTCRELFEQSNARNAHALFIDQNSILTLYGGADQEKVCDDIWQLVNGGWQPLEITTPGPRTFAAVASSDSGTYMFGGNSQLFSAVTSDGSSTLMNDLWLFSNEEWTEVEQPEVRPSPRAEASLVFDEARKHLVLFGGYEISEGEIARLGDTWRWDGDSWLLIATDGPQPQNGASFAYDKNRQVSFLFGQADRSSETWEWDGQNWTLVQTNLPRRYNSAMAFDETLGSLIRFGGWDGNARSRTNDTWILEDREWRELEVAGPEARNHSTLVFNPDTSQLFLYGGHNGDFVFGDLWEFSNGAWQILHDRRPIRRSNFNH